MVNCLIFGRKKYDKFINYRESVESIIVELIEKYQTTRFFVQKDSDFGQECLYILKKLKKEYTFEIFSCEQVGNEDVDKTECILSAIWNQDKRGKKLIDYASRQRKLYLNIYDFFIKHDEKKSKTIRDWIERQNLIGSAKCWLKILKNLYDNKMI
ncbi:MAG: hypothetical protein IJ506_07415 [Clostridia bacterium]|nr:hypothetical protein [Clostridia bacterium]